MKNLLNYNLVDLKAILLNSNVFNLITKLNGKITFYLVTFILCFSLMFGFALLATMGIKIALFGLFGCMFPVVLCLYKIALYKRILFNVKVSLN